MLPSEGPKKVASLFAELGVDPSLLKRGLQDALVDLRKMDDQLSLTRSEVADFSKKTGLAFSGMAAGASAFIYSSTRLAARVETLGVVTARLGENVGMTEDQIRSLEQSIVSQGITLQKSREAIAMMIQAEVDLGSATDLAREAQNAAVIANMNSSEAFRNLIAVIQTGNIRMGRTMGLQLNFNRAQNEMADSLGKNVDQLTEQERIQARTNEVLRAGVNITGAYESAMETAGKQVLSLDRHIEESRRIIGEAYLPIFSDVVEAVTDTLKSWEGLNKAQQRGIASGLGVAVAWSGLVGTGLLMVSQLGNVTTFFNNMGIAASTALGPIGLLATGAGLFATAVVMANQSNKVFQQTMRSVKDETGQVTRSYDEYVDGVVESAKAARAWDVEHKKAAMTGRDFDDVLIETLYDQGMLTEEQWKAIVAARGWNEASYKAYRGLDTLTETQKAAISTTEKLQQEYDNWKAGTDAAADSTEDLKNALDAIFSVSKDLNSQMEDDLATMKLWAIGVGDLQAQWEAAKEQFAQTGDLQAAEESQKNLGLAAATAAYYLADDSTQAHNAYMKMRELAGGAAEALAIIDQLANNRSFTITGIIKLIGGGASAEQIAQMGAASASASNTALERGITKFGEGLAVGGQMKQGIWTLVGETGPELIGPNGRVYNSAETRKMMATGLMPQRKLAVALPTGYGGEVGGGIGEGQGGGYIPPSTYGSGGGSGAGSYIPTGGGGGSGVTVSGGGTSTTSTEAVVQTSTKSAAAAAKAAVAPIVQSQLNRQSAMDSLKNQRDTDRNNILSGILSRLQEMATRDDMESAFRAASESASRPLS